MATKRKFGYPSLALLDWLCEEAPGRRFFTNGGLSSHGVHLYQASEPDVQGKKTLRRIWPSENHGEIPELLDRLDGRDRIDYSAMYHEGLLRSYGRPGDVDDERHAFLKNFSDVRLHFSESIITPTEAGYEFWRQNGRAQAAAIRAERDAARNAVKRDVLIAQTVSMRPRLPREVVAMIPKDITLPLPSRRVVVPYALATVARQTDSRIYVRDVRRLPLAGEHGWRSSPIEGNAPNQHIQPSSVMVDGCGQDLAERLCAVTAEFQEEVDAMGIRIVKQMIPGLADMASRLRQKEAEYTDTVAEVLKQAGHDPRGGGFNRWPADAPVRGRRIIC